MTSTADPAYIRQVSVSYQRCPSSYSCRSSLSKTNFVIQRRRPQTAAEISHSARDESERILDRGRTEMLDELMFLYGRNVSHSFDFTSKCKKEASTNLHNSTTKQGTDTDSPWNMANFAVLQMRRTSRKSLRHRLFPQISSVRRSDLPGDMHVTSPLALQCRDVTSSLTS